MAIKHSTGWWNLKRYAKRVLSKADFAVFWAQKEVVEATTWVQTHYTVIKGVSSSSRSVPMQMDPSMDILGTQTAQKKRHFWAIFDRF